MPEEWSPDRFEALLEETFQLRLDPSGSAELVLVEVTLLSAEGEGDLRRRRGLRPAPFSLLFRGAEETLLPQGTYWLEHPYHGTWRLFLVPVDRDQAGLYYEAVFN